MKGSEEIRKRIIELGAKASFRCELAEVTAVNEAAKTCSVKLLASGLELVNIRLTADTVEDDENYFVQIPQVGSSVVVAKIQEAFWFVLVFGDLEKVIVKNVKTEMVLEDGKITANTEEFVINEGGKGGLIVHAELVKILNALNAFLTGVKGVLNVPVVASAPGSPDAFHAALNAALSAVSAVEVSAALVNDKVKHG